MHGVLILNNFNCSFINLSGFKKLNGSQLLKENITYILNMLKSYVDNIETKKKILHIFNSNFYLVQNNDVIVVNPNYSKIKSAGFIGSPTSIASIASLALSITLLLINNN